LIKARGEANMTREQVARAMGTTPAVVARLVSGRVMPSTRTLKRFAEATGMRPRIGFEPAKTKPDRVADQPPVATHARSGRRRTGASAGNRRKAS
jgi:transcriptional regulator with XRE-family HTH domain